MDGSALNFNPLLVEKMLEISARCQRRLVEGETFGTARCLCNKVCPLTDFKLERSKHIPFVRNICAGCEGNVKDMALVICARCKDVVCAVPPHRIKNGFTIKADVIYHVAVCCKCEANTKSVQIAERTIYELQLNK